MGHMNSLLSGFSISECGYVSLPLEQRRWQKRYCSCQGDGYIHRHHSQRSTSTHAWGARLACSHPEPHGDCRSSCYLNKSETKNKNGKEILRKNGYFFRTNCPSLTKRTGHYTWPHYSFSWSDCTYDHPSFCRTSCSLSPCGHGKDNHSIDCLDDDYHVGNCCNCASCFDDCCNICGNNAAGSLIHGYGRQKDEPFSSLSTASCPWQFYLECQPPCGLLNTAQRKQSAWEGQWALPSSSWQTWIDAPWAARRRFVHLSLAPWVLSLFGKGSQPWDSLEAVLDAAWTHASAWEQASWLYKASKSAGHQHWKTWQQPWGNPWYIGWKAFVQSASSGHCFAMTLVHLVRPMSWKHWPMRLNRNGPSSFCSAESWVKIFDSKLLSVYTMATWPVNSLAPFLKEILVQLGVVSGGCFRPSLIRLSGVPLAPKDVQWVYQLNWGVFCISDIVTIFTCLDLDHVWVLIAYLLDRAGISTSANDYYNRDVCSSRWPDWSLEYG